MRFILGLAVSAASLAVLDAPAAAQQIPSPYRYIEERMSLGLEAGYLLTQRVEPDLGPRSGPMTGARFLIRITAPVSGEMAVGFVLSEREVFENAADPQDPTQLVPWSIGTTAVPLFLAEAGFRLHVTGPRTWNGIAPFVSGTVGGAFNAGGRLEEEEALPTDERFTFGPALAVSVGTGADIFLSERMALRADLRNRIWRVSVPAGFTELTRAEPFWRNNISVTLGAAYHF
jgi:hypothetical protein